MKFIFIILVLLLPSYKTNAQIFNPELSILPDVLDIIKKSVYNMEVKSIKSTSLSKTLLLRYDQIKKGIPLAIFLDKPVVKFEHETINNYTLNPDCYRHFNYSADYLKDFLTTKFLDKMLGVLQEKTFLIPVERNSLTPLLEEWGLIDEVGDIRFFKREHLLKLGEFSPCHYFIILKIRSNPEIVADDFRCYVDYNIKIVSTETSQTSSINLKYFYNEKMCEWGKN